jgi:hypothetical protein
MLFCLALSNCQSASCSYIQIRRLGAIAQSSCRNGKKYKHHEALDAHRYSISQVLSPACCGHYLDRSREHPHGEELVENLQKAAEKLSETEEMV